MIRKIIIGGLAAVVVLAGSSPAFAESGRLLENSESTSGKRVESTTVTKVEDTMEHATETEHATEVEHSEAEKNHQVETRKAELLDRLAEKQTERKEKLEGRRLAQCENRQKSINSLLDQSVTNGKTQLGNIQRVEARVAEFYAKKKLSSTSYDAALEKANLAEADAMAALQVLSDQDFDCKAVDGAKPNSTIQTTHQSKREALQAYRQSVIDLIHITKEAFVAQQKAATESEASDAQN